MAASREAWFAAQPDLDPERLIFIDETGLSTRMARLRKGAATVDVVIVEGVERARVDGQQAPEGEQVPRDDAPEPLSGSF